MTATLPIIVEFCFVRIKKGDSKPQEAVNASPRGLSGSWCISAGCGVPRGAGTLRRVWPRGYLVESWNARFATGIRSSAKRNIKYLQETSSVIENETGYELRQLDSPSRNSVKSSTWKPQVVYRTVAADKKG